MEGPEEDHAFMHDFLKINTVKVSYQSYDLKFKYPFGIFRGTKTHQPTLIVQLEHLGRFGLGEAPAISYYHIPVDKMIADLEQKKMFIEKFAFTEPERYWHYLHHLLPQNHFLVCALDIAAWDMYGKIRNKPLKELFNIGSPLHPVTDYTIGIDRIEKNGGKAERKAMAGL